MYEQYLADGCKPDARSIAAGLYFKGLRILEKLDDVIVHTGAIERPVPSKDRFKRACRRGTFENAAMRCRGHGNKSIAA
jgi:hypothetical protein